ncbi:hypothetical protein ACFXAS_34360 [Streptomyces sp. NPDC059459]
MITTLAVQPDALTPKQDDRLEKVGQGWYEDTPAEQLRQDQ